MHKLYMKFLIICLMLAFGSGCTTTATSLEKMIVAPESEKNPVEGVWCIESVFNSDFTSSNDNGHNNDNEWIGKTVEFSKKGIKVGDQYWSKPVYTVIRSDAREYFMYRYGMLPEDFSLAEKEVFIISISSEGKHLYDFIRLNGSEAIIVIQDNILWMNKVADIAENIINITPVEEEYKNPKNEQGENKWVKSGVLIGIRSNKVADGREITEGFNEYKYKTLWISTDNMVLNDILETKGIFFPRRNGFWKIDNIRITDEDGNSVGDYFKVSTPYSLFQKKMNINNMQSESDKEEFEYDNTYKLIQYISNDYVSLEVSPTEMYMEEHKFERYKIMPIDNITNPKGMKIYELVGWRGVPILKDGREIVLDSLGKTDIKVLDDKINEENIALTRKMGHWFLKGRLNYMENGSSFYSDFIVNMIPPKELVWYDTLCISWNAIKGKVPGAIDAYTSPAKDIAVIATNEKLFIYPIVEGVLGDNQLGSVKLMEGDTLVMAEWATGNYVDLWEKSVRSLTP